MTIYDDEHIKHEFIHPGEAERLRALEQALAKCDPWDVMIGDEWHCKICGGAYEPYQSNNGHKPNCLWLEAKVKEVK